ncbi:MAG TPA: hypothetical protein PKI89_01910 [Tepidiformaceae bacterium]|nr:hypothetical protein [Tepidiformaceae bacterium]HNO65376.1 hypothetical protein [Tepidiformaceae bacterium]
MSPWKVRIWNPKAMIIAWLVLALGVFGAMFALADDAAGDISYVPIPGTGERPTTDAAEADEAVTIATASAQANEAFPAQSLVPENPRPALRAGVEIGTTVDLRLPTTTSATTDWLFVRCQQTRQVQQRVAWEGISLIRATVEKGGRLIEFAPIPDQKAPPAEGPKAVAAQDVLPPTTITDLRSGEALWTSANGGSLADAEDFLRCPPGLADD